MCAMGYSNMRAVAGSQRSGNVRPSTVATVEPSLKVVRYALALPLRRLQV